MDSSAGPTREPEAPPWRAAALAVLLSLPWFLGSLQAEFVTWDDDRNFVVNERFRGLGWEHIRWMFTTVMMGHWQPLAWLSMAVDHAFWGMDPRGYHATNLLLHAINTTLVFALIRRMLGPSDATTGAATRWAAAAGAVLFAAHPLRVEAVTWITERRLLLSTPLLIGAVLLYVGRSPRRTAAALVAHALAMSASTWGVVLPPVLWLLDDPAAREPVGRRVLRLLPFAAIAAFGLAINVHACDVAGVGRSLAEHSVLQRAMQAAYGLWFYLARTVVILGQSPLHELPASLDPWEPRFLVAAAAVAAIAAALVRWRRVRGLWTAAACYAVVLFPVLGIYQPVGLPLVAERYSYLALIPWIVVFAAALRSAATRAPRIGRWIAGPLPAIALAAAFGPLTLAYTRVWRDSVSLWSRAVDVAPQSQIAATNLGHALELRGRLPEAVEQYQRSLALRPGEPRTRYKLGLAYARLERYAEAIVEWRQVLRVAPNMPAVHYCIGLASFRLGQYEDAVAAYRRAVELEPGYVTALMAMSDALRRLGRTDEARAAIETARAVKRPYQPPY